MLCPECGSSMRSMLYEGVSIETCDGCGGEFVAPDELAAIVRTREKVFGEELHALYADHKPSFGLPDIKAKKQLTCPACEGVMKPVNYACDTGVIVDRCGRCGGVWLEIGELEKIQAILETWQEQAPAQLRNIAFELEDSRRAAAAACSPVFSGSRFSFINAVINRFLDAA